MIRTTVRKARTVHRCGCGAVICPGAKYLEHVASPDHDDLGNQGWWRLPECQFCADRYGRGELFSGGTKVLDDGCRSTCIVSYTGNLEDTTMFKNMTDAQLDEAIYNLRVSINNAFGTKSSKNMNWMLRQLDIAVAVRRQRQGRKPALAPPTPAEVQAENARMFRAEVS